MYKKRPDTEAFLEQARGLLVGKKVVGLDSAKSQVSGYPEPIEVFQVVVEGNQVLVFFAPAGYGLGEQTTVQVGPS